MNWGIRPFIFNKTLIITRELFLYWNLICKYKAWSWKPMQTYPLPGLDLLKLLILLRLAGTLHFDTPGQWHWELGLCLLCWGKARPWRQCAQAFPLVPGMPFWVSSTSAAVCQLLQSWAESDLLRFDGLAGCCRGTFTSHPSAAAQRQRWHFVNPLMGTASQLRRLHAHVIGS